MTLSALLMFCVALGVNDPVPGDDAFARLDYPSARNAYETILQNSPQDPRALWRLARVFVCMGDAAPEDGKTNVELYRQGETYARGCISADPDISEAHTWLAAALGSIAFYSGNTEKVALSHEIKRELDVALSINPNDDIAWSILGSFYRAIGNVSWIERQFASIFLGQLPDGGYAEAETALRRAIALAPDVIRHHYELGLVYLDMDRKSEAREQFEKVLSLPVVVVRDRDTLKRAKEYTATIEKSLGSGIPREPAASPAGTRR